MKKIMFFSVISVLVMCGSSNGKSEDYIPTYHIECDDRDNVLVNPYVADYEFINYPEEYFYFEGGYLHVYIPKATERFEEGWLIVPAICQIYEERYFYTGQLP